MCIHTYFLGKPLGIHVVGISRTENGNENLEPLQHKATRARTG